MKKTALLILLSMLITLLFCQDSTAFNGGASSQDLSISSMFKNAIGEIITILLTVLIALFVQWLRKFDIFIELPQIKETASRACLNADHILTMSGEDKKALIRTELETAFNQKQHNIITKVFKDGLDGLIEHTFKKVVKPERLYRLIKSIGK